MKQFERFKTNFCTILSWTVLFVTPDKDNNLIFPSNNNNNNIHICIAPYGRNFRGANKQNGAQLGLHVFLLYAKHYGKRNALMSLFYLKMFWYVLLQHQAFYMSSLLFARSSDKYCKYSVGQKNGLHSLAITPLKVDRLEWDLEHCKPNVAVRPWQILGMICSVPTVWEAVKNFFL